MEATFADCVLMSREGEKFYSVKGILSHHSPVLQEVFKNRVCETFPGKPVVCLNDSSSELQYLLDEVHGPGSITFDMGLPDAYVAASTVERLRSLTRIAFKYEMQGILDQIDRVLCNLSHEWTEEADNGNKLSTWRFACCYNLRRLAAKIDQGITPWELDAGFAEGKSPTDDLPSHALELATNSMANMLRRINDRLLEREEFDRQFEMEREEFDRQFEMVTCQDS